MFLPMSCTSPFTVASTIVPGRIGIDWVDTILPERFVVERLDGRVLLIRGYSNPVTVSENS